MKLNQLIAVMQSVKQNAAKAQTEIFHVLQKAALFSGLSRTYTSLEEGGYVYPPEYQKLTYKVEELLQQFSDSSTELFNLALTQDVANTTAVASLVVDGIEIQHAVPVSYLLFLEKQLQNIKAFVTVLPVLAVDKDWTYSEARGFYVTEPKQTVKTKKITDFVVAYEATPQHPAQIKEVTKDIIEGTWALTEFSGALPKDRVTKILKRIDNLSKAVIQAREAANKETVEPQVIADKLFGYLFS
jgi:hypothetical protein